MRRTIWCVVAVLLIGTAVTGPWGTAAASDPVPQVVSVTLDPGPFRVDGFAGQGRSTITVVVDDTRGQAGPNGVEWSYTGVRATLRRTAGGTPSLVYVDLPAVSSAGTVTTYSAPWRIASTRTGTWTLTDLSWSVGGTPVTIDPRVQPGVVRTVTVVGTRPPTATVALVPQVVAYRAEGGVPTSGPTVVQWAHITYRDAAGAPLVGATVLWGTEYACMDPMPPTPGAARWGDRVLRTDALGKVVVPLPFDFGPGQTCVSLLGLPAVAGDLATRALVREDWPYPRHLYQHVTAAPLAPAVRVRHTLTVAGSAYPASGTVWLQRLVGRTWRTVATARIRPSGRFTLLAIVPVLGRSCYRVVALRGDPTLVPTASRSFRVTGTLR